MLLCHHRCTHSHTPTNTHLYLVVEEMEKLIFKVKTKDQTILVLNSAQAVLSLGTSVAMKGEQTRAC